MAYKLPDPGMRDSMIEMMKDEFRPFKRARDSKKVLN
jgi:hypothetical protein